MPKPQIHLLDLHKFGDAASGCAVVSIWLFKRTTLRKQPLFFRSMVCQELTTPLQDTSPLFALSIPRRRKKGDSLMQNPTLHHTGIKARLPGVKGKAVWISAFRDRDYLPHHKHLLGPRATPRSDAMFRADLRELKEHYFSLACIHKKFEHRLPPMGTILQYGLSADDADKRELTDNRWNEGEVVEAEGSHRVEDWGLEEGWILICLKP